MRVLRTQAESVNMGMELFFSPPFADVMQKNLTKCADLTKKNKQKKESRNTFILLTYSERLRKRQNCRTSILSDAQSQTFSITHKEVWRS